MEEKVDHRSQGTNTGALKAASFSVFMPFSHHSQIPRTSTISKTGRIASAARFTWHKSGRIYRYRVAEIIKLDSIYAGINDRTIT